MALEGVYLRTSVASAASFASNVVRAPSNCAIRVRSVENIVNCFFEVRNIQAVLGVIGHMFECPGRVDGLYLGAVGEYVRASDGVPLVGVIDLTSSRYVDGVPRAAGALDSSLGETEASCRAGSVMKRLSPWSGRVIEGLGVGFGLRPKSDMVRNSETPKL